MKNKNASVGLFVIGGLALFGAGLFLIGDRRQAFGEHAEYYSEFINLAGLSTGAEVRVGGMAAGEVVSIGVPDSPSSRFRVKWRIRGAIKYSSKLRKPASSGLHPRNSRLPMKSIWGPTICGLFLTKPIPRRRL